MHTLRPTLFAFWKIQHKMTQMCRHNVCERCKEITNEKKSLQTLILHIRFGQKCPIESMALRPFPVLTDFDKLFELGKLKLFCRTLLQILEIYAERNVRIRNACWLTTQRACVSLSRSAVGINLRIAVSIKLHAVQMHGGQSIESVRLPSFRVSCACILIDSILGLDRLLVRTCCC